MRKKKALIYTLLSVSAVFLCSGGLCWAIAISVTGGSWSETIGSPPPPAGSNLPNTRESTTNAISINITSTNGNWGLTVNKTNIKWHDNLHLWVKRTSDGSGLGSISGGSSYVEATDIGNAFFNGNGDRSNVNIQLQLTGISIQVPPDTYTATIYYTVTDQ
jgi:hypothetical protein